MTVFDLLLQRNEYLLLVAQQQLWLSVSLHHCKVQSEQACKDSSNAACFWFTLLSNRKGCCPWPTTSVGCFARRKDGTAAAEQPKAFLHNNGSPACLNSMPQRPEWPKHLIVYMQEQRRISCVTMFV